MTPNQTFVLEIAKLVIPFLAGIVSAWNVWITQKNRKTIKEVSDKQDNTNAKLNGHMERLVSAVESKVQCVEANPSPDPKHPKET